MGHITAELTKGWMMEGIGMQVILRILLSLALAAIIGCERSSKRHSAGMRTFMLVSVSATAAVLTDLYLSSEFSFGIPVISGAAVVGIAMLSGNSILFSSKNQIKGLTTSAALRFYGLNGWDRNVYFRICDLYGTSLWDFPVPICRALFKRPFQSF